MWLSGVKMSRELEYLLFFSHGPLDKSRDSVSVRRMEMVIMSTFKHQNHIIQCV